MSFLDKTDLGASQDKPSLSQRGRAGIEFLGTVQKFSSGSVRSKAREDFESDRDGKEMISAWRRGGQNEHVEDLVGRASSIARKYPTYRLERFLQRYVAEEVYLRGVPAVEERREQFERMVPEVPPENRLGTLELDDSVEMPEYYDGVEWHLEPGGWDGYDLYGPFFTYVAGPYIFKHGGYAAVEQGDDIIQQRVDVVKQLPKKKYSRIYEPGCGGLSTLAAASKVFPEAELVGSDLSELLLKNGHAMAQRLGVDVSFKQRDARDTGEDDESFDAVLMYALMHEMPKKAVIDVFREALRILKPDGDLVISDPPPFRAVDPLQAAILDWDTKHRGEPYFSEACSANWVDELRALGYVYVEEYALGDRGYPWVTRAKKAV